MRDRWFGGGTGDGPRPLGALAVVDPLGALAVADPLGALAVVVAPLPACSPLRGMRTFDINFPSMQTSC